MTNTNCLEGVKCPACGNEDRFRISVTIDAIVTDGGAEPADNNHWDWNGESDCRCCNCGHYGKFKDFKHEKHFMEKAYDSYFDDCERANRVPLSYAGWLNQQKG